MELVFGTVTGLPGIGRIRRCGVGVLMGTGLGILFLQQVFFTWVMVRILKLKRVLFASCLWGLPHPPACLLGPHIQSSTKCKLEGDGELG